MVQDLRCWPQVDKLPILFSVGLAVHSDLKMLGKYCSKQLSGNTLLHLEDISHLFIRSTPIY